MAGEKRSFFKRSFEILGGTAIEIGKDYTSNLQSLVSDAGNIKNTVIRGASDAKTQFQNMRKGVGPIKGLIDWFYTKESEYDPFDLDNADSDFDPGTSFGEPEDEENKGPATLDVKGAEKVAKGQIASMFKIASKIAETQVANTAEIITTVNSRTSEIVAAANNINTTLIGISKKLDVVTSYINARTPNSSKPERNYNSLVDSSGRFNLGTTWNAAKQQFDNSGIASTLSILSTLKEMGGITPESVLRFAYDMTLGDREFKKLGNQSLNQIGRNLNEAIGDSISDAISAVIDSKGFKKLFGDLKEETRSNDFRRYTTNEYSREPAVFDGMTRTSIIKTIPEYLKKIYESMSGQTLYVDKRGNLTTKETRTFNNLISESMFERSGMEYDDISGFLTSEYGAGSGMNYYDANTLSKALTGTFITMMILNNIRVMDQKWVNPRDDKLVGVLARIYATAHHIEVSRAEALIRNMLMFISSDRSTLRRFVGNINQAYERSRTKVEEGVNWVVDQNKVGELTESDMVNALTTFVNNRSQSTNSGFRQQQPIPPVNGSGNPIIGSGDPLKIYAGAGAEDARTVPNMLSDIRELLSVQTKKMVGSKKYVNISAKLSKPTIATTVDVTTPEFDPNDISPKARQDYSNTSWREAMGELRGVGKDALSNASGYVRNALGTADGNILVSGYDKATGFLSNRVDDLKNLSKDQIARMGNKISDTAYNLSVKTGLAGLGNSKNDEEDRNTVSMISAFMQTAMQSGSASPDEKNSIQRLIDSIHDQQLKSKMSKSVNAMLDRASIKSETGKDGKGGKTIFGKVLGLLGLIVSPIKLMSKAITFMLPKIFTGLRKYTKLFNFGKDFGNIKQGFSGLWSGIKEYRQARREYKDYKREQAGRYSAIQLPRASGTFDANGNYIPPDMGAGTFATDGPQYDPNDPNYVRNVSKNVQNTARIAGSIEDRRIKELKKAQREAEKAERRLAKEQAKAEKREAKIAQGGFKGGFASGFYGSFKGLGTFSDFKDSFKEAAGITGKKVTVEGVDGEAQSFTDRILAKFMDLFTGKEDSVFRKIEENTEEEKSEDAVDQISDDVKSGKGEAGGVIGAATQSTGTDGSTSINIPSSGGTSGALMNLAEGGSAAGTLTAGAEAASGAAGAAGAAGGVVGTAGKALSMIGKIGASVGKIVGSLGTIGLAVAKIVIKATLMLSGFKALMKTIGSITTQLTKVVKILLEPLNKIFHAINKILKPIIKSLSTFFKKIAGMISSVVGAIVDTIVPILNGIIMPIMKAIEPVLDIITNTLGPIFELLQSVIDVVFIPIGGIFKYIITPIVKQIANVLQIISGVLEIGFGGMLKALGTVIAGIGIIGKVFGASGMYDAGKKMASSGDQMIDQGMNDVKNGFINSIATAIKATLLIDQTEDYDNTHIKNPNATEITSVGSVMEGTVASGDFDRIYGSGNKSQRAYGSTLDMSNNGCGPLALADAASRRSGSSVDGLSMASRMVASGTYEPGRGTSVGSFMSAANSMGMGLRAGGVTQSSLKYASPNNPITVVGSGADFGTRKGNNHYMNVVGTDSYGGAYVSNPLTGRVDRKSASSIAGSSLLGLYGGGDSSDYYTFPDVVSEALSELKNLTSSILGMFTTSASESMNASMNEYNAEGQINSIRESINNAQGSDKYDGKTYEEIETAAREAALKDFETKNPRQPGETEDAYNARFEKWYTPSMQLKYLSEQGAYEAAEGALNGRSGSVMGAFDSMKSTFSEAESMMDKAHRNAKQYGKAGSAGTNGRLSADSGAILYTDEYEPTVTMTNITNGGTSSESESPLHEFFSMMSGNLLNSSNSVNTGGWYGGYNRPVTSDGVSESGGHEGIDFNWSSGSEGKPLYATTNGTVVSAGWSDSAGNNIKWVDEGGYYHWYMHMRDLPTKKEGDTVDGGELLGYVGNTGNSDGAHLHYSIHSQNPAYSSDYTINPLLYFNNYTSGGKAFQGKISLDGMLADNSIWSSYQGRAGVPTFINAGKSAGMSPAEIATLMSTGIWEDSGEKIFGIKSLNGTTYDYNGQAAKGIMNWVDQNVNYGDTVLDQLRYIHNTYFDEGSSDWRALVRDTGYNKQDEEAFRQATGRDGFTLNIGDRYGPYANKDLIEGSAHFFKGALVPEKIHTAKGMAENVGTAVEAYNWMIDNGYATIENEAISPTGQGSVSTGFGMVNSNADAQGLSNINQIGSWDGKNTGTTTDNLNLREKPSTDSAVLTVIPKGTKLNLEVSGSKDWFKTTFAGKSGYVSAQFIALDKNETTDAYLKAKNTTSTGSNTTQTGQMAQLVQQMQANLASSNATPSNNNSNGVVGQFKNANSTYGFDIWSSAQYRKLGTSADANDKRKRAFEYLAKLSDMAFNENNSYYNPSFRNDWYIPGGKSTDQLSHWGSWALDYYNWDHNPNKYADEFPKELKALKNVYGAGDSSSGGVDFGDGFTTSMNDISGFAKTLSQLSDPTSSSSGVTINRVTVASNDPESDKRINAILNNTFKVRAERVEYLLERIIEKMDNEPSGTGGSGTTATPEMFTDNTIPAAVERLSRG